MGAVFAAIGRFFTTILQTITGALGWFADLVIQVFVDLWEFITDAFVWVFDSLLGVAVGAVGALDVSGISQSLNGAWSSFPAEFLNVLGLIGLAEALGIVGAAILIRLGLQLIPFVRLGS
ncbi:DUF2523 domain-containing protein [Azoarcus communis]|uniref:DUF2523 family protein n=1 Tax=Parazoarcus communis TaxID=41977 RepID=UPI0014595596|nr:DUF2523 family protein [Parazoarcus communis]NMG46949.1 DUF2523 domain-containing protein [Parazoarcus communis]